MSLKKTLSTIAFLMLALLVACSPAGTEPETTPEPEIETPAEGGDSDVATDAAVAYLAEQLGIPEGDIQVVSAEATEFSDGCLGLGGPAESCLQAITPGWVVMLSAGGAEYELRTDAAGQQVRMAGGLEAGDGAAADAPSAAVQEFLVSELGVSLGDVQVISAEPTEFSDGCLGLGGPTELCAQVITPGWIITTDVMGQTYVAHTDETGQQVRLVGDATTGDGTGDGDAPSAAVQEFLVNELGVTLGDVQVVSAEQTEFSDGCLGLGGPEESCLQAITPGWIVTVDVQGQTYVAHTDETGQQVRLVP